MVRGEICGEIQERSQRRPGREKQLITSNHVRRSTSYSVRIRRGDISMDIALVSLRDSAQFYSRTDVCLVP